MLSALRVSTGRVSWPSCSSKERGGRSQVLWRVFICGGGRLRAPDYPDNKIRVFNSLFIIIINLYSNHTQFLQRASVGFAV